MWNEKQTTPTPETAPFLLSPGGHLPAPLKTLSPLLKMLKLKLWDLARCPEYRVGRRSCNYWLEVRFGTLPKFQIWLYYSSHVPVEENKIWEWAVSPPLPWACLCSSAGRLGSVNTYMVTSLSFLQSEHRVMVITFSDTKCLYFMTCLTAVVHFINWLTQND